MSREQDTGVQEPIVQCTAQRDAQGDLPNPLFTPPCECPNCRVEPTPAAIADGDTMWLTVDGRRVRFDVDALTLGDESRALL